MNKNYLSFKLLKTIKPKYIGFILLAFANIAHAQTTLSSSGTFEVPAGITSLSVETWGAGGGAGGSSSLLAAGGGGGGGAYKKQNITITPNKNNVFIPYTVGNGGAGGTTANIDGADGGTTTFQTVSANGGKGGKGGTSLISYGNGGLGGNGGDYSGGNGANAYLVQSGFPITLIKINSGGGGGGSAGSSSNGNSTLTKNGATAVSNGGSGADGGSLSILVPILSTGEDGQSASTTGGGGGGGVGVIVVPARSRYGGNGGNGKINLTYNCPTYSITDISATTACVALGTATINLQSTAAGLPIGTYTVTYHTNELPLTNYDVTMIVENAGSGSITIPNLTTVGTSTISITKLKSGGGVGECSTNISSVSVDVIVKSFPDIPGSISGYTNQCSGNTLQNYSVTPVANATSYNWTVDTASGWVITAGQGTSNISVTVGTSNANIGVVAANECGNSSIRNLMIDLSVPALIASATLQPNCTNNMGTIVVSSPSATGNIGYSIDGIDYSNTTGIFTLVPIGDYNITAKYPSGCITSATLITIASTVVTRTWNGSWDGVGGLTMNQKIIFDSNYNFAEAMDEDTDIEVCSCVINSGVHVTIKNGHQMKIQNELIVDEGGSLTFENNASLVQINDDAINSGKITYTRTTTAILNTDYVYWSAPVSGFTLGEIQSGTIYSSFNAVTNKWVAKSSSSIMLEGIGYIVRGSGKGLDPGSAFTKTVAFKGQPNNGVISTPIIGGDASNLIGNPYPSAIDANTFLIENADVLTGTLYFWTHNTAIQLADNILNGTAGSGKFAYTSDDYATYNLTGGVGTGPAIAAGQGFMATGKASGNAIFKNSMRLDYQHAPLDNSQFLKPKITSKPNKITNKSRIWLNLTNAQGAFKQMLVGYITGATNEYDEAYDGENFNENKYINFYSINNNTQLTIQGRALPFNEKDEVPLGYSSSTVGQFSISIDSTDGVLTNQQIYLKDKELSTIHNLKTSPYVFSTDKGTFDNRFALVYQTKEEIMLNVFSPSKEENLVISVKDKNITLNSAEKTIAKVILHTISGKKIYQKEQINTKEYVISNVNTSSKILLITTEFDDKTKTNQKVIY
ncbi:glycine-rich domain-containing protein [Flavobacterium sp.]|uniref:glycine-rich domain-containing protein n=1 Tax=Flavobacterium sp. TaxID=239 RepID=UPI003C64BFDD